MLYDKATQGCEISSLGGGVSLEGFDGGDYAKRDVCFVCEY
jgi:hypothetical protein